MPHDAPLIATIVAGFVLAFACGAVANRLRVSPLVGYLVAGIIIGPYTPGFQADQALTLQLAEIGVMLLMFGVGLHFSIKDLLAVKAIAVPGAVAQIALATIMGMALAWGLGWTLGGGLVFGLALSVASTVVLLRALEGRHLVETDRGRIAVGWLVVEDLAMVLTLVLLPAVAGLLGGSNGAGEQPGLGAIATAVALTIAKVAAFVAVMLLVGRRAIPWLLHHVAHSGSRELFRLAVLAIALGVAYGAAHLFDVSLALGAFFAGMVLSESELSQQAAHETLPLRDAFAVLFFVSVGMLFDPLIVVRETWPLLATLFIIVLGKSVAAYGIVRAFGHSQGTALTISASLAQIGEFSFILAGLGVSLGLMPEAGRGLILGGAILSIFLNPLVFDLAERIGRRLRPTATAGAPAGTAPQPDAADVPAPAPLALIGHVVVVGYGRVGSLVGEALAAAGRPYAVIEMRDGVVAQLQAKGVPAIAGNAATDEVIRAASLAQAAALVVAIPNAFEAGQIVEQARRANPGLEILARAHFDAEVEHLHKLGASTIVMGEREIARAMITHVLGAAPAV